jgi:hypothetical protein
MAFTIFIGIVANPYIKIISSQSNEMKGISLFKHCFITLSPPNWTWIKFGHPAMADCTVFCKGEGSSCVSRLLIWAYRKYRLSLLLLTIFHWAPARAFQTYTCI